MNISMIFHVNTNVPGTGLLLTGGPNVRPTLIESTQLLLKVIKDTQDNNARCAFHLHRSGCT